MATVKGRSHSVSFTLEGPMFNADPGKTFDENCRTMFGPLAVAGERAVKDQSAPYVYTGTFFKGVVGRTFRLDGAPFKHPGMIVSQRNVYPWKGHEGQSGEAAATIVGGFRAGAQYRGGKQEQSHHMFRRAFNAIRKIDTAALLKGLNE